MPIPRDDAANLPAGPRAPEESPTMSAAAASPLSHSMPRARRTRELATSPQRLQLRRAPDPGPGPAEDGPGFFGLDAEPRGAEELAEAAAGHLADLVAGTWSGRSKKLGFQAEAARNIRLYLLRAVGLSLAELGARADPPISKGAALRACDRGAALVERVRPASRFNPDRPPARAERRRGEAPGW